VWLDRRRGWFVHLGHRPRGTRSAGVVGGCPFHRPAPHRSGVIYRAGPDRGANRAGADGEIADDNLDGAHGKAEAVDHDDDEHIGFAAALARR
jgi:hypothetical protein